MQPRANCPVLQEHDSGRTRLRRKLLPYSKSLGLRCGNGIASGSQLPTPDNPRQLKMRQKAGAVEIKVREISEKRGDPCQRSTSVEAQCLW